MESLALVILSKTIYVSFTGPHFFFLMLQKSSISVACIYPEHKDYVIISNACQARTWNILNKLYLVYSLNKSYIITVIEFFKVGENMIFNMCIIIQSPPS